MTSKIAHDPEVCSGFSEKIVRNQNPRRLWRFSRKLQDKKPMRYIGL